MADFAQYGPGKELLPANVAKGILRRNSTNDGWEEKQPENILNDAAAAIDVNGQKIQNVGAPTPGSTDVATTNYADSVGVNSVNRGAYLLVSSTITTGLTQPLSIADATMTGLSPGGGIAGAGVIGVVAVSFASLANETGTGVGQGGLGSAASVNQPYNATDFPGQHGVEANLFNPDNTEIIASQVFSTVPIADAGQQVFGVLSYRSDLGANLKWRLWFYYHRKSDGVLVPFTPDTSLTNVILYIPNVTTLADVPVGKDLGHIASSGAASGVTPGILSDIQNVGTAAAAGSSGRFSDAQHVHAHGTIPRTYLSGGAHDLASAAGHGFMASTDFSKLAGLPSTAPPTSLTLTAGAGLTGGGDLTANRTFNVGANADGSITVNADDIQVGVLASDAQHGTRGGGSIHAAATQSVNGFMSSTDKVKLDNIAGDVFNVTTQTTTNTPFDITAYTPPDLHACTLAFRVTARKTDGTQSAHFEVVAGFRRAGSTTTQVGNTKITATIADTGFTVAVDMSVTSATINVRVTGLAATTIDWRAQGSVVLAP